MSKTCWAAGATAGLIALLVYLLTLAPTLTWAHDGADGGDLVVAVLTGGVPHPPGYPTYLLLGSLFARLQVGDPAFRLNLMSAVSAAAAAAVTGWTATQLAAERRQWPIGLMAGLALAFSPVLWSQAVIAEVYAPAALFTALVLWLALSAEDQWWRLPALGWALGAGLGVHLTLVLLAPVAGLTALRALRPGKLRWSQLVGLSLGLALGLVPFVLLPLRARGGAPVNWGEATTFDGWWWLVSAQLYRPYVFALPLSALPARLSAWAGLMVRQFTPLGAMLAVVGWQRLWHRDRALTLALGATSLVFSAYAISYNTTDSYVYLVPVFVIVALTLALGLVEALPWLETRWRQPGRDRALALGLALLLPAVELVAGWPAADLSHDRAAHDFGVAVMGQAPPNAVLVTKRDAHTFALWYFHYGLGQRPDVAVVDSNLWGFEWYRRPLAESLGTEALADLQTTLSATGRPVCTVLPEGGLDCR